MYSFVQVKGLARLAECLLYAHCSRRQHRLRPLECDLALVLSMRRRALHWPTSAPSAFSTCSSRPNPMPSSPFAAISPFAALPMPRASSPRRVLCQSARRACVRSDEVAAAETADDEAHCSLWARSNSANVCSLSEKRERFARRESTRRNSSANWSAVAGFRSLNSISGNNRCVSNLNEWNYGALHYRSKTCTPYVQYTIM